MKGKSILSFAALTMAVTSMTTQARSFDLPAGCEYGRVKSYDVQYQDVRNAIDSGYDIYNDPQTYPDPSQPDQTDYNQEEYANFFEALINLFNSFDYLRVEVPKHVLQDEEFRAKGNLFDRYAYVRFNNSEFGYVGKDKSNLDANSYLNMKFSRTYGYGLVWINRAGGMCSAEGVWVQKKPRIVSASASHASGKIQANVQYLIDKYSTAAKDTSVNARLTIRVRDDLYGQSTSRSISLSALNGSQTISITPANPGINSVSISLSDGKYTDGQSLGYVRVPGTPKPPCPRCQPL
ncbi:hypothetical protein KDD30_23400 (plasmid) [Photobacterium sp. GJ3]|uniref:hypothetical protein n=1 Tax=Photobacterium sp. GJ3 TaxID=2829502 RepID=UPI001B8B508D|nr:hypothetical protein [Photobacterium sp. GJ3]QUJ69678.1 hypothetical protein KDD30_23400 [Photobacterium sp. GJ3]